MIRRLIPVMLALALAACLTGGALASEAEPEMGFMDFYEDAPAVPESSGWVQVNDDCSIRTRPGEDGPVMEEVESGRELEYQNVTEYDSEGVAWYRVGGQGWTGWVSSGDATLQWPTFY